MCTHECTCFRPKSDPFGCVVVAVLMLGGAFVAPILLHCLVWVWGVIERWWAFWGFKW